MKADLESHIHIMMGDAESIIRNVLGISMSDNLSKSIEEWYEGLSSVAKNSIYDGSEDNLMHILSGKLSPDNESIVRSIVRAVTGMFVEDWNDESVNSFKSSLQQAVATISNKNEDNNSRKIAFVTEDGDKQEVFIDYDPSKLSVSGAFLKNALLDALGDYEETTENTEKIGILLELAKELMNQ